MPDAGSAHSPADLPRGLGACWQTPRSSCQRCCASDSPRVDSSWPHRRQRASDLSSPDPGDSAGSGPRKSAWSARRLAWFDDRIQAKAVSSALLSADRTGHRVVVADDDVLLREGVAGLLERSGFEIVGQAGDATELVRLVRAQEPDLVIVDIRMPPRHETQ